MRQVSASPATVSSTQENLRRWEEVVTAMDISGLAKQLALACIIQDLDSKRIHLAIRPHDKGLLNSRSREILRVALQKHFGVKFHVEIEERDYDGVNLTTLFEERQRKQRSEELELYKNESVVAGITKVFGAQMDEQSFQPPE
ncbi:MAG: DNA polymerase III subunit gamma/tau C-terminal domain-containing protein [Candidatus Eutrophobiaceae bacterium]